MVPLVNRKRSYSSSAFREAHVMVGAPAALLDTKQKDLSIETADQCAGRSLEFPDKFVYCPTSPNCPPWMLCMYIERKQHLSHCYFVLFICSQS